MVSLLSRSFSVSLHSEVIRFIPSLTGTQTSVTILLRLPSLIKYSTHIAECVQFISSSPYAQPSDKWLCALVRLQRLLEEVAVAFDMDDPAGKVNFLEAKIQYQLKSFERQLELWKQETDVPVDKCKCST